MRTRTAKKLRMLTLVCWTILAIGLLVMIQKAANTIELQKNCFFDFCGICLPFSRRLWPSGLSDKNHKKQ